MFVQETPNEQMELVVHALKLDLAWLNGFSAIGVLRLGDQKLDFLGYLLDAPNVIDFRFAEALNDAQHDGIRMEKSAEVTSTHLRYGLGIVPDKMYDRKIMKTRLSRWLKKRQPNH